MRPLNRQDYLMIAIVVLTAVIGICALTVSVIRLMRESRRAKRLTDPHQASVLRHRLVRKIPDHR
jgi:hypothetical protein